MSPRKAAELKEKEHRSGGAGPSAAALRRDSTYLLVSYGKHMPEVPGSWAEAFIETADGNHRLTLNQARTFPTVFVEDASPVRIRLVLDNASPGDDVVFNVLDGGDITSSPEPVKYGAVKVDSGGVVDVEFTPSVHLGSHRILFRYGGEDSVVDIWHGEDAVFKTVLE